MTNKLYKFTNSDDMFIYVIAKNYKQAKEKIKQTLGEKEINFKYCVSAEAKVNEFLKKFRKGEMPCLDFKLIENC